MTNIVSVSAGQMNPNCYGKARRVISRGDLLKFNQGNAPTLPSLVHGIFLCRVRPHMVMTTGALPGLIAVVLARLFGACTLWLDIGTNDQERWISGGRARRFTDMWIAQSTNVAFATDGVYAGSEL